MNLGCGHLEQVRGRPTHFTPCFQVMYVVTMANFPLFSKLDHLLTDRFSV